MAVQMSFVKTMLSSTTLTDVIDFGMSFNRVYLDVPSRGIGNLHFQVAAFAGGTFRRLVKEQYNTSTVHTDFLIMSSVSNKIVPIPCQGVRFIKIESSSAISSDETFNFICGE
jgi:hypothetical protein